MEDKTITFTFNEDCRCFKKGRKKTIKINDNGLVWMVGSNQSGKSTLLQLMRSRKNALRDTGNGIGSDYMAMEVKKLKDLDVVIDGLDAYDHICYLDSIVDDPVSMENSAAADMFFEGGGYMLVRQSKGQKALSMLGMFMANIDKTIGQHNGRNLIVLDEVDEGFDISKQSTFIKAILAFKERYNADIICVLHSILPILMSDTQDVFDIDSERYIPFQDYISLLTEKKITISIDELSQQEYVDIFCRRYDFPPIPHKDEQTLKSK